MPRRKPNIVIVELRFRVPDHVTALQAKRLVRNYCCYNPIYPTPDDGMGNAVSIKIRPRHAHIERA